MRQRRAENMPSYPTGVLTHRCKSATAAVLGFLLLFPQTGRGEPKAARRRRPAAHVQAPALTEAQRNRHLLDRFTFGPRPGEAATVDRTGRNAWFEQQLHPERIADAALQARLLQFPAMQLTQADLLAHFPSPQRLRQYSRAVGNGGDAMEEQAAWKTPDGRKDPIQRAIYRDAAWKYEQKAADAAKKSTTPAGAVAPNAVRSGVVTPTAVTPNSTAAPAISAVTLPIGDAQAILRLPPAERFARLVSLSPPDMQAFRDSLKGPDQQRLLEGLSPAQAEEVTAMQAPEHVIDAEVMATRLLRDAYSERQLQAVMTDFWLNHFNVYARKNQDEPYLLPAYEQSAVLPHALGRFEDLLVAVAQSPAMLMYLDNWTSVGPQSAVGLRSNRLGPAAGTGKAAAPKGINENYARELLELHTLGVTGGYTQRDVEEVAKCFTGWTIEKPAEEGSFRFDPKRHEPGAKLVLGHVIPEGGEDEGLTVLHLLAASPATAHLISQQLAERFVSDAPPPALVERMAHAYLQNDGEIAVVLRVLYRSPEFWAPATFRAKVKTPLEFVLSAVRASDTEVSRPMPLVQALNKLGMPLYGMATPNGYSWQSEAWVSSNALLNRMNFALLLIANKVQGAKPDWLRALGFSSPCETQQATTFSAVSHSMKQEQALEFLLLGQPASMHTRAAVLAEDPVAAPTTDSAENGQSHPELIAVASQRVPLPAPRTGTRPTAANPCLETSTRGGAAELPEVKTAAMAGLLLGSPEFQRR